MGAYLIDGLSDKAWNTSTLENDVRFPSELTLSTPHGIIGCTDESGCPHLMSPLLLVLGDILDDNLSCPETTCPEGGRQTNGTRAENQHAIARLQAGKPNPVKRYGEGFDDRTVIHVHSIGESNTLAGCGCRVLPIASPLKNHLLTPGRIPRKAGNAEPTASKWHDGDQLPRPQIINRGAACDDLPRILVSQHIAGTETEGCIFSHMQV
ncbi:hypothetical protein SAMN05444390_11054 [Marinobacterium lutimaris]|uniref:Uncharacterized protein n=1 Tax=Marinobacterium lutimaris TaxID=568106 RepID=A0A1H6DW24_9GAMM|nr:hypothetical protein SAMN05444390_11054 [Marinobacterium lutimaris]